MVSEGTHPNENSKVVAPFLCLTDFPTRTGTTVTTLWFLVGSECHFRMQDHQAPLVTM